jgi:vacuolar-type H+-ATPase subunit H
VAERATARPAPLSRPPGPIGSFLERFRGSPGVPAAVGEEAALELVPVFAALDDFEEEAAEIREHAEAMASNRLHRAVEDAEEIRAAARSRADSERDDALKAGLRAADAEASRIVAQAEVDARRIDDTGDTRVPALVDEVLARVLEAP